MRKVLTDAQFTEAVYRHYNGSTLSEIAAHFGIHISTLSETRKRRRQEWDDIYSRLIDGDLMRLKSESNGLDARNRERMTSLLALVSQDKTYTEILCEFGAAHNLTEPECKTYIKLFELLLPVRIPRPNATENPHL